MTDNTGNSFELSLIGCKCIGAYVRNKKNQNQVIILGFDFLILSLISAYPIDCLYLCTICCIDLLDMAKS